MPASQEALGDLLAPSVLQVLIVEDDPGDALLVREMLAEATASEQMQVEWVRSVADARQHCGRGSIDCVLVDLGLPDATGLGALGNMLEICPESAVVVLTGQRDRDQAIAAVAAGAQDYLLKDEINPALLDRTIRLAVQRRTVEKATVSLAEAVLRERHNRQVARGLLPHLRVRDRGLRMVSRYQPGNDGEVLGGDFLDAVELDDGTVRLIIGDVAGHGPEEAAVGVNLRIAWRALTLAANPVETIFRVLNDQVANDTGLEELFATVADLSLSADRRRLSLRLAGHPAPLLCTAEGVSEIAATRSTVVGLDLGGSPPETVVDLPASWRLLLYTDGLVEGRDRTTGGRWGVEGLIGFLREHPGLAAEELADALLGEAARRHGASLPDDVALLLVCHDVATGP